MLKLRPLIEAIRERHEHRAASGCSRWGMKATAVAPWS